MEYIDRTEFMRAKSYVKDVLEQKGAVLGIWSPGGSFIGEYTIATYKNAMYDLVVSCKPGRTFGISMTDKISGAVLFNTSFAYGEHAPKVFELLESSLP